MNYAAFLAVLVTLSFVLPLLLRVVLWLNPTLVVILSIIVSMLGALWLIRKQRMVAALPAESSQEFSSSLLTSHSQEEDLNASL